MSGTGAGVNAGADASKAGKSLENIDTSVDGTTGKVETIDAGGVSSTKGVSEGGSGVLDNANYAQKTYSKTFSAEGRKIHSDLAGEPINTIDDFVNAINSGKVNVADLPIECISRFCA